MFATVTKMPFMRGLAKYEVLFSSTTSKWFQILRNSSSGLKEIALQKRDTKEVPVEMSFSDFLQHKRDQARRSIVFQIDNIGKWQSLFDFCSSIGEVNKLYHYVANRGNFILIEVNSKEELKEIVEKACFDQNIIHHFALFDTIGLNSQNISSVNIVKVKLKVPLTVKLDGVLKSVANLKCSLSEKISELSEQLKLDDICVRLRFLTCLQIECLLGGLLKNSTVYPFGSSLSGFGFKGCDLDLVVLEDSMNICEKQNHNMYFPTKFATVDRKIMQSHLQVLANVIETFLVGCKSVNYIKHARVPIIKFQHYFSSLECDLSLYVHGGVVMTQLLYAVSNLDERVIPLVSVVRVWAKKLSLTSKQPGPHISNFSFTLLVIFFLQQKFCDKGPVLPSLNIFPIKSKSLMTVSEELSAINNFKMTLKTNDLSLEELLVLFFTFYSSFNFITHGCCVNSGKAVNNFNQAPLFIKNPLDPLQNVSKNVNSTEISKFQSYASCARDILTRKKSNIISEENIFNELFSDRNYKSDTNNAFSKKQNKIDIQKILSF